MLRSSHHERWLTTRESLLAMGFPIFKQLSYKQKVCSFAGDYSDEDGVDLGSVDNDDSLQVVGTDGNNKSHCSELPSRTATSQMAGNSMHVESVGIMILFILSGGALEFERFVQQTTIVQQHSEDAHSGKKDTLLVSDTLTSIGRFLAGAPQKKSRRQ